MTIYSRTPEGFPARCPLCGAETNLEFSDPGDDAPCPNCGQLLWMSSRVHAQVRQVLAETLNVPVEELESETVLNDLHADSLTIVELVMRFEDLVGTPIPDQEYEQIRTIGDLVRYLLRPQRGD